MRAWSFTQPWLHAILKLGKRLDNRPRGMTYRGEVLLHASAGTGSMRDYYLAAEFCDRVRGKGFSCPMLRELPRGGICGIARIVDCHPPGSLLLRGERWYMPERDGVPQYGIILADVAPLPFTACKGALGLWSYEPKGELLEAVEAWRRSRAA
jgi:hypothetical protein